MLSQNEELPDSYRSHGVARILKSRRLRWVGNVVRKGERDKDACRILARKHCKMLN
jgi:hypothetical protein